MNNSTNKRRGTMNNESGSVKRAKVVCSYGESCYRRNPAHFREFTHPHLETILDNYSGTGDYPIPDSLVLQQQQIIEQLEIIVEKNLYTPINQRQSEQNQGKTVSQAGTTTQLADRTNLKIDSVATDTDPSPTKLPDRNNMDRLTKCKESDSKIDSDDLAEQRKKYVALQKQKYEQEKNKSTEKLDENPKRVLKDQPSTSSIPLNYKSSEEEYVPMTVPKKRIEDYFKVVAPKGRMKEKHRKSAPYHIFYTTIDSAKETHNQPYSITFQELLDPSLGELKASLQINFMVDIAWLMAHYYFAGYSNKRLTVLYGDESMPNIAEVNRTHRHVDTHHIKMASPFGKHHTKMMLLCYEDGSMRVVVSTANAYPDDWENRTQGLWLSPACPALGAAAMPHEGESPTGFKRSLLGYLAKYAMPQLTYYVDKVKRCDFSAINVFLVASVPGGHFDAEWGLARAGALLRQHCRAPRAWPLVAQASSIGSYGSEPKLWLTGDFLHSMCKTADDTALNTATPPLELIYPSLENVRQSHDGMLGGGCLPYAAAVHAKQPWLNQYLHQWKASRSCRGRAMPHIKSYLRRSPDGRRLACLLLTSANVSKAAWGAYNKGNRALRLMSYEAGVLLLPAFMTKEDYFSVDPEVENHLPIPYDLPPVLYEENMSPWVMDYLH